jgi:serine/threonine protein phosphatase 1
MKHFVIGDIHGGYKSMMQCFERAKFNYEEDELIVLGDVVDGWPDTYKCVEELLKVKNLILILSNHDAWAIGWFLYSDAPSLWTGQGGWATIHSYNNAENICVPQSHIDFFRNAVYAYVDDKTNTLFVHGGIDCDKDITEQSTERMMWDRELLECAYWRHKENPKYKFSKYNEIYVGHTTTFYFQTDKPMFVCNVIGADTGGGYEGYLTIIDRDTKQYWQSDKLDSLYPGVKGR